MARRDWVVSASVLLLLAGVVVGGYWVLPRLQGGGEAAPFTVTDLDDRTHNLTDYAGQVFVIDFMATWCGPCKVVQRNLAEVRAERPDLAVLSIDIDPTETRADLDEYRVRTNLTWPVAMDSGSVAYDYGVFSIPKVVVIDPDGVVAFEREGLFNLQNPGSGSSEEVVSVAELRRAIRDASDGSDRVEPPLRLGLVGLAVVGGALSFFAPCAFPLLPAYMGYFLNLDARAATPGATPDPRSRLRRGAVAGLVAGAGVLTVYGLVGLLVWFVGQPVKENLVALQPAIGVVAVFLGIALVAGLDLSALVRPLGRLGGRMQSSASLASGRAGAEPAGSARLQGGFASLRADLAKVYGFGAGYGACASSCTAPFFLSLLVGGFLAGPGTGLRVFLAYALAAALLMVLVTVAVAASRDTLLRGLARRTRAIQVVSGVVLVAAGAYLVNFYVRAYGL